MCIAHRLLLSTSEISDATASMPSPGYFALQHRVAPPRKAYSLTSSAFIAFGALYPFSLFKPVFRGYHKKRTSTGRIVLPEKCSVRINNDLITLGRRCFGKALGAERFVLLSAEFSRQRHFKLCCDSSADTAGSAKLVQRVLVFLHPGEMLGHGAVDAAVN